MNGYDPGSRFRRSSPYGDRIDPFTGKTRPHAGQDFVAPAGTPIPAASSGIVVYSGPNENLGNVVIIKNDTGDYSLYGHMQDGDRSQLGRRIWLGDTVGLVGSTGRRTTGNHLHYSVITKEAGELIRESKQPRGRGGIGIELNKQTTIDPARYDNYDPTPRYLDETRRSAQIMSGRDEGTSSSSLSPSAFGERFGNWGSAPASITPPPAHDGQEWINNGRFGTWGSARAGDIGTSRSPVLRALQNFKRSAVPDGPAPISSITPLDPGQQPPESTPPLGIVSGKPMSPWSLPPSVVGQPGNSGAFGRGDWFDFLARIPAQGQAPRAPAPQPTGSKPVRMLSRNIVGQLSPPVTDTSAPAPPLAPSDDSNFSGGLLGRLVALAGIDPQNPTQPAPSPLDDQLRGFYRDDPRQPWLVWQQR